MDPLSLLAGVLLFSVLGALLGTAAGLLPGLHVNNLAYVLGASSGTIAGAALALLRGIGLNPGGAVLLVAVLIVSSLTAHLFASVLPSVYLGAPDPGRALSVLPAHRLLLEGRGQEAVRCSLTGCAGGLAACLASLPIFRLIMGDPVDAYEKLRPLLPCILLLVVALLIASEPRDGGRPPGPGPGKGPSSGAVPLLDRSRCALVLSGVRMAALVLSGSTEPGGPFPRAGREGEGAAGPRRPSAGNVGASALAGPLIVRPWQAPLHVGERVSVAGVVSDIRREGGRTAFVLEEGSALEVLVPPAREGEVGALEVGQIVIAEGVLAPAVSWRWGVRRKLLALGLFLASGFLGLLVLSSGRMGTRNWFPLGSPPVPSAVLLFPLFCGLFGLPTLLLGLLDEPSSPPQRTGEAPLPLRARLRGVLSGAAAGGVLGWYPAMTPAHGSVLARLFTGDGSDAEVPSGGTPPAPDAPPGLAGDGAGACGPSGPTAPARDDQAREFLVALSAVTAANTFFNLVALFVIDRARSGALQMASEVLGPGLESWRSAPDVPLAFAVLCVSAAVAALVALPLTLRLGRLFAGLYDRVPYRRLLLAVVALLLVLMVVFSGLVGLAVAVVALCLGLVPPLAGARRVHLMGALLLPAILFHLDLDREVLEWLHLL